MWLLIGVLVLIAVWIHRRFNKMSILSLNGIPGNRPHLIFGNMFEMKGLSMVEKQNRLIERYGKIVGYYSGAKPTILVANPELAKNIQIKDFHNFTGRSIYLKYFHPSPRASGAIVTVRGQQWKQIRSLLSPAFSASKLRTMTPIMEESVNSFLQIISKKYETGKEFNIYDLYQRLTLEMLIKTAFGTEIDAQNETNDQFMTTVHKYIESKVSKLLLILVVCFPELFNIINFFRSYTEYICNAWGLYPVCVLWKLCTQIIDMRKQNQSLRRNDILQAMLDSKVTDEDMSDVMNESLTASHEETEEQNPNSLSNGIKPQKSTKLHINLTEDEIIVNCIVFLGAGYDTSSTGLAYTTHMLINHPEVQEKVRREVIDLYESEGKLDFNTVTKLQYMEWVLNETMRIYPPLVNGSTRECVEDYKYENITIPKGSTVVMCTHYIHHDPDYWPEPEKFDPMRFSPERKHEIHPSSWQPFGAGPRNCIGMRLAYLKMKLTLAKLLLNYRLESGPHSETGELKTKYKLLSVAPKNGVYVRAIKI